MVTEAQKEAFRKKCLATPIVAEEIIAEVYSRMSGRWDGATAVDGGANNGFHTLRLAALSTVETVIAFEPHPETVNILRERLGRSPDGGKVRVVQAAIQADPKVHEISFAVSAAHPGRSGINPIMAQYGTTFESRLIVAATTLDAECADAPNVRFLKLDLEGGEYAALRGGAAMLAHHRPVVVFENSRGSPEANAYTIDDLLGLLAKAGLIPLTMFGERMNAGNQSDFWYAWAFNPETDPDLPEMLRSLTA